MDMAKHLRIKNACWALAIILCAGSGAESGWPHTSSTESQVVWYWYGGCRESRTLKLQVLLGKKLLHASLLRICRMRRNDLPALNKEPEVTFSFAGGHVFQGDYRTTPKEVIQVNIWQAGSESNGVWLGISFTTGGRVLLNTLHFVRPERPCQSILDDGLLIRTNPVEASKQQVGRR
jgi:hypothetical protein